MEQSYEAAYIAWLQKEDYRNTTINSYLSTLHSFLKWITAHHLRIENIRYNDVLLYIEYNQQRGNKQRTIYIIVNGLNHFYRFLVSTEQIKENPVSDIEVKGIKRRELHDILSSEELNEIYENYRTTIAVSTVANQGRNPPPQYRNSLSRKRNKILLGFIIYQGLNITDLSQMELNDIHLTEGKITINRSPRKEHRILSLESNQMYALIDYINNDRAEILRVTNKKSNHLFTSVGRSYKLYNSLRKLIIEIKKNYPKVKSLQHIRTSVITNWLKRYNLREVQYRSGHRYVSSTEAYQINNIDQLQDDINKYHPIK